MSAGPTPPFLFPKTESKVLPDPSKFFSPHLLSSPLPTNSFFQNFVLRDGDEPEYIHPYLIKSYNSQLFISYPRPLATSTTAYLSGSEYLTIRARQENSTTQNLTHRVSSFSDLSVTLDFPSTNLSFFLVRGSPFVTCEVTGDIKLIISTPSGIRQLSAHSSLTKYTIKLGNHQTWLLYSSLPIKLGSSHSDIYSDRFSGVIRIALLTDSNPLCEAILDKFSSCYPVSGDADITKPFCVEYKWQTVGGGGLLMLAHPLHLRLLSASDSSVTVLEDFKYNSSDGELVGVIGDSWVLKSSDDPLSITWHSLKGIKPESRPEIRNALKNDVEAMVGNEILTKPFYLYAQLIARAARFAIIAEEVSYDSVIPRIARFLKDQIEPWLDGTYDANGFLYDGKWGGIVMKRDSYLSLYEFGLYHDHHFPVSYILYAIAVLAKIEPAWGNKYKPQAYSVISDFMNLRKDNSYYPRLRCFDLWNLHSWTGGLDIRHSEQRRLYTVEVLNAYYSATLLGLVYRDTDLVHLGSMLSAMEINSANTWWHVREEDNIYAQKFTKNNRMVGMVFSDGTRLNVSRLEFNILPLIPITEVLFSDATYVRKLVKWAKSIGLATEAFVYALEGIYDKEIALSKIRQLKVFGDGNSFTNLLWWIHSRGNIILPPPFGSSPSSAGNSRSSFTYEQLRKATNEFSKSNLLGEGGFGPVYKGLLTDGQEVAIKQLNSYGGQGEPQFRAEVEIISRIHHRRLVSLVGYCISEHHKLLVYDYVPNGTLYDHLHGQGRPVMAWAKRVRVATGAARGMAYLHEDCCPRIIHRDIKSSNILLDHNFDAKVADFGLAKLVPETKNHVSTIHIAGTPGPKNSITDLKQRVYEPDGDYPHYEVPCLGVLGYQVYVCNGYFDIDLTSCIKNLDSSCVTFNQVDIARYMAPEYVSSCRLTEKFDVYSFGVVLLELITGRTSLLISQSFGQQSLVEWARPLLTQQPPSNEDFQKLVDRRLEKNYVKSEVLRMIKVAAACVSHTDTERPQMSQVVIDLAGIGVF